MCINYEQQQEYKFYYNTTGNNYINHERKIHRNFKKF